MAEDAVRFSWRTGAVDLRDAPPVVWIEGYPPKPSEGHVAYAARLRREMLEEKR